MKRFFDKTEEQRDREGGTVKRWNGGTDKNRLKPVDRPAEASVPVRREVR